MPVAAATVVASIVVQLSAGGLGSTLVAAMGLIVEMTVIISSTVPANRAARNATAAN